MSSDSIGRYVIRDEIGRGGMATVYLAYDPRFERDVAVKVLPPEFLHDPRFRARFEREAKTIAMLQHPAIVPVFDYGEERGWSYLVMRYMPGGSLSERLDDHALPLRDVARIVRHLATALDSAHAQGIIHRDLKPGNILFDEYDNPYLSDFGIVKITEGSGSITDSGVSVGTPAYMSPEQAGGSAPVDHRTDLYALGVVVFEALTGGIPYQASTPVQQALKHITDPVPRILTLNPDLPDAVDHFVNRALAKNPAQRFQSAGELAHNLSLVAGEIVPGETNVMTDRTGDTTLNLVARKTEAETLQIEPDAALRRPVTEPGIGSRVPPYLLWLPVAALLVGALAWGASRLLAPARAATPALTPGELPQPSETVAVPRTPTAAPGVTATRDIPTPTTASDAVLTPTGLSPLVIAAANITQVEALQTYTLERAVHAATWSPDGTRVAIGTSRGYVEIRDSSSGEVLRTLLKHDEEAIVTDLAWSPDGTRLATSAQDGTILWLAEQGEFLNSIENTQGEVKSVAFSHDGSRLATGGKDGSVVVWDAGTGTQLLRVAANGWKYDVIFSPDDRIVLSSGADPYAPLIGWDLATGDETLTLGMVGTTTYGLAWSADGKYLAQASQYPGQVLIWDFGAQREIARLPHDGVDRVAWSPLNNVVASKSTNLIRFWDALEGRLLRRLTGHSLGITVVAFSPDGTRLMTASLDGTVIIWGIK